MASAPESSASESALAVRHWLEKHNAGDQAARGELIEISMRRLRLLARRILTDIPTVKRNEDTDDLLQNSLVRLWKCLEDTKPKTTVDYFRLAACMIRRELIDLFRHYSSRRSNSSVVDPPSSSSGDQAKCPPAVPEANDDTYDPQKLSQWTEFHEYVERLPEEDRALFDLLWYQGLTMADASELLSIPLRTLGRRWKIARVQLYQDLLCDSNNNGQLDFE